MTKLKGIFINGTSSAGKTTIARRLQVLLPTPSVYMSIDTFLEMMPFEFLDCPEIDGITTHCDRLIIGFQKCILSMTDEGNFVIVDHVVQEPHWLAHLEENAVLDGLYKIGVFCDIEVVERREIARGDRPIGLARLQYERVHLGIAYDMEIDTSNDPKGSKIDAIAMNIIRRIGQS